MRLMRPSILLFFLAISCGSSQPTATPPPACGGITSASTPEECECLGGTVKGDIGDGKVACAEGERELGRIPLGIEGSICCAP
jgi:hypothetical protein